MEIILTDENFEKEVLESDIPCLVDFWAPWCGPCRMLGPVIEEVAREYQGKVKVGKLNVDEGTLTASKYGIMSIPTVVLFDKGKTVEQSVGAVPKEQLAAMFKSYIEK